MCDYTNYAEHTKPQELSTIKTATPDATEYSLTCAATYARTRRGGGTFRQTWPLQYRLKAFPFRSVLPSSGPMHKYYQPLFVYIRRNSSKRLALNAQGRTCWIPNPRKDQKGTINFTFRPTLPPWKETPAVSGQTPNGPQNRSADGAMNRLFPSDTTIEHCSSNTVRNARSKAISGMHSPVETHSRQLCCITC